MEVTMVLENYVILQTGIPSRVHFFDHVIVARTVTDPGTGAPATRRVLVFEVDKLDGRDVAAKYSIMAEKHAGQFAPYLADKSYRGYDFVITKNGEGFLTSWSVKVIPRL
jgi:hypothetical protein